MKINCCNFFLGFFCFFNLSIHANDTIILNDDALQKNLKNISSLYVSENNFKTFSLNTLSDFTLKENNRPFVYLDFNVVWAYIKFNIDNGSDAPKELVLSFSYPFLEDVTLYKYSQNALQLQEKVGIKTVKQPDERSWKATMSLVPKENATYFLVFHKSKGKPLATDITIYDKDSYNKKTSFQNMAIGAYLGLALLSFLFTIFIFGMVRISVFLLYGLYLILLVIFIGSYLGYTNVFLPVESLDAGRTIYVISIELSTAIFVLFAQQILLAKKYLPKLKKSVELVLLFQLAFRVFLHFVVNSMFASHVAFFMKLWYLCLLFLVGALVFEIFIYLKHNKKVASYFAISYLFMAVGSIALVLHHSFGLLKLSFYGLPGVFYASTIEILFLTMTLALVVGQTYQDRNVLAKRLVVQQQKFLNAFLQGQEEERRRVGGELHDNIGSKIANLKRHFGSKYTDKKMAQEFDEICEDVRQVAHRITPAEITLVGLSGAIEELLETIEKTEHLKVNFNTFQFPEKLSESISTHLFRIVQELLQNVLKHANANVVDVQLFGHKNSITLSFEDDGQGMSKAQKTSGIGLKNIKSRVAQMNGQFLFDAAKDQGTSVLVIIPTKNT